jgi:ABC-type spermidine/putrescine transport system permease subunit II
MTPEINAVSTIIFVFSLVAIVVWYRLRVRDGGTEAGMEIVEAVGRTGS